MKVLVTGGTGYIGSHTCIALIEAGHQVVVVDNLANSKREALTRVEAIVGKSIAFYCVDVTDAAALTRVFEQEPGIDAAIHFAGLKAVGESCEKPGDYYRVNIGGSLVLAEVMERFGVELLAFSSSATVYGDPARVPILEDFPTGATNPYGRSKLMVEEIYTDLAARPNNRLKIALLRYFNPIGAHISGTIGEDPKGIPNNLLPFVAQVAVGKLPRLRIFGDDYPTVDGTGVRDYIHVVDLAQGHVAALNTLLQKPAGRYIWNLGTGQGYSVLQVVAAFEAASGRAVPYDIVARRPGDIAACYADPSAAAADLEWRAAFDLERMVTDAWRWQSNNPDGY
jgi:UDP-glucose 4-epimerase